MNLNHRSAMHIIDRGKAIAAKNSQSESYAELMKFYRSKISSDPTSISEWYVEVSIGHACCI